ncbi:hypothetical protein OG535_13325 [Kitasatospora sp. NBC_00085]|uniref:DUF6907 domain-containing protein n=1 Tax=Kitasatospora sp. NBC_00085 TaxID=2903566 RepID=UPI00324A779F
MTNDPTLAQPLCGARQPGWEHGPAIGRHRQPCILPAGHDDRHRDGLGQTWRPRTATVRTVDHGPVTVPCPPWCLGVHEDGLDLVDLAHEGPETALTVDTPLGGVQLLDAGLCQYPYSSNPDDREVKVAVLLGADWHQLDHDELRMLAAQLVVHAGRLRDLAAELRSVEGAL